MKMKILKKTALALGLTTTLVVSNPAMAIFGIGDVVFDPTQAANMITEFQKWKDQFDQMNAQIEKAKDIYNSATGVRGYGNFMNITNEARNYLPKVCYAARIDDDERCAALRRLLEEGRGDGMVLGRVGADDHDDVGVLDLVEGRGHGAGADALDQRRHRRGVTQPRAVIDVVVAEARADQLLEQIGFFVRAFGRAECRRWPRCHASWRPCEGPWRRHPEPPPSSPRGNGVSGFEGSTSSRFGRPGLRISGFISRCGLVT